MSGIPRVLVVGGGIAGLGAAWECHRRQIPVRLLEASEHVGGVIRTDTTVEGYVLDAGPDAFLAQKPGATILCRELGLEPELVGVLPPRRAYILADDRLHPLPEGGALGLPIRASAFVQSSLLSWPGKARVALEPVIARRRWTTDEDESAGSFFSRRFGHEAAARIAQPLLGGIHAGDLGTLSARAVIPQFVALESQGRSVLLALRRQNRQATAGGAFRSLASGMGRLPSALREALPPGTIRTGASVAHLARTGDAFAACLQDGAVHPADIVLLAIPAWAAAPVLEPLSPPAARICTSVPYVSSATVLLAYPAASVHTPLAGSGYVVAAARADDPVIAVTSVTGKWPGRAPPGTALLRVFFGGAGKEAAAMLDEQTLIDLAHAHLTRRFSLRARPAMARVYRWIRSSPQHQVGHGKRVRQLQDALDQFEGLGVAGSGFRAIGIPDVVADARAEMGRLLDRWHRR